MAPNKSQLNKISAGRVNGAKMVPRRAARKIPTIALLIESSRASGRAMLCGIAKCAHHYGPWSFYWEPGGLEKAWPKLKALDVDGIILRDVDKLEEVLDLGIPAVVVGHSRTEVPGMVNVVTDSAEIGRIAAEHLLQCGFKHFAFCGYGEATTPLPRRESFTWSAARWKSFARHVRRAGFEAQDYTMPPPETRVWREERHQLAAWLQSLPKPVGLMACNDDCGRQIMEACKLARLAVPDAVGVVGADNDEVVCGLADPPMSSVVINFERAGYETALVLFRLLRGSRRVPSKITVAATHVVARRSTDIMTLSDPQVTKALQFIRDHARENIAVDDVARAAGLSRRALEIRFRRELGCSIHHHVRRVRTDQIARLLVETEMSVARIADSLGFPDVQHFARYFRAVKQISPLAYRKAYGSRAG
ncbi:MAG: DNA-binding transcriptional regulator [Verrucomicrobiota bacterium]|nr:DNA-binding transcriptional regulator [Verrucomicrobiota bacterium]